MAKLTKKQKALQGKVDTTKLYSFAEAIALVKEAATAKFDESIDVAVQLGVDAKKSDQVVRGAVVLPHGTGKTTRVAVFAQGAKAEEAKAAGADVVGMDDLAAQVKADDKSEALVSIGSNHHGQRQTGLNTLSLRIECLTELHDVQATLTQRRTDWRGWVGLTSWHLQLDEADDLLRHV